MESFKIEHFKTEHPSTPFPWFKPLDEKRTMSVRRSLSEKLRLASDNPLELTKEIDRRGVTYNQRKADDDNFELVGVFADVSIRPQEKVFINWYRFDKIDEIGLSDLNKYFDDIWYPGPDDIDIFDSSLEWVLSICHEGYIKFLKL